jgi:hypothetical protein
LRDRFTAQMPIAPREITATVVTNDLVNRAGIGLVDECGAPAALRRTPPAPIDRA